MGYKPIPGALRHIIICLAVVSFAALLTARLSRPAANSADEKKRIWEEQVHKYIQAGLGREVKLAGAGACPEDVWASVDSVTAFIRERSGLKLDHTVIDKMASLEERVLNGHLRRVTAKELGAILAGIAIERIKNGSDDEIKQVANGFANVKVIRRAFPPDPCEARVSDKVANLQDKVMVRSNGHGIMSKEDFITQAKDLRANLQSPLVLVTLIGLARQHASDITTRRVRSFAEALPGQWDEAQRDGLTPVQSLLVVYSVASDDPLWYSNAELRQMMKRSESHLKETTGVTISSEGHVAYGNGGYIFSTPLDLALDQRTTARIFELIEERSAK